MLRSQPRLIALVSIVIGVLGFLLWQEHREVTVLRASVTKSAATRGQLASLQRALAAARKNPTPGSREPVEVGAVNNSLPDKPRVLSARDRQIRAGLLQNSRWMRLSKKAEFIAGMNLPPEKLARFKDLLVERDYAETDAKDAAEKVGINPDSSDATDAANDAVSKVDERIKALLGDADYQKYNELTGIDVVWGGEVRSILIGYFVDAGAPALTAEQTNALARAFYQDFLFRAQNHNGQPEEPDPATGFKPSQMMVLDQAAQVLSAGQLETLRNFFRNDNQLGALMKASQSVSEPR